VKIKVKRLHPESIIPTKANASDAGWDLYSTQDVTFLPFKKYLINTGIAMSIPDGFVGLIWDRSGLASKHGIHRFAGVIDSGYRGEIKVCLYNSLDWVTSIKKGERIAQLLIQEIPTCELVEVDELEESSRGEQGFGSSGK